MVMVPEDQFEKASEIIGDYLGKIQEEDSEEHRSQYSIPDKIRMIMETLLFTWFVPGKKRIKSHENSRL